MAENQNPDIGSLFELYRYTPSIPAAAIFAVLFATTTAVHIYQLVRTRTWYFLPLVIGGIFQVIGYIGRILAHNNLDSMPIYSVHTITILLAPALYAVSIYMVLGRLITFVGGERLSLIRVKWITRIFVCGDIIAFCSQAAGGGTMASGTIGALETGEHITVAGLCVQLAFFSFFILTATNFHLRFSRISSRSSVRRAESSGSRILTVRTWETVLWSLYITSVMILVRSAFRVIEFGMGNNGYLLRHEVFAYVFDATLMFITMVCLIVVHPASIIKPKKEQYGSEVNMCLT
ncbi:hypothetical protein FQN54_003834 [Arachnomyces sp. PD_36]|nr:hypothetical protein FQN54_003834 [Arachnomyces sp. PD_36]